MAKQKTNLDYACLDSCVLHARARAGAAVWAVGEGAVVGAGAIRGGGGSSAGIALATGCCGMQ
jgi:hypothetical protein